MRVCRTTEKLASPQNSSAFLTIRQGLLTIRHIAAAVLGRFGQRALDFHLGRDTIRQRPQFGRIRHSASMAPERNAFPAR